MTQYTRPKGILGGPCSHCGLSQPEHVGKTCEQAKEVHDLHFKLTAERANHNATMNTVKEHLETMIHSAQVYVDAEDVIVAYKIKTGALHKLIGFLGLTIPANHPVVEKQS